MYTARVCTYCWCCSADLSISMLEVFSVAWILSWSSGAVAQVSSISGGQGPRAADCAPAYKYKYTYKQTPYLSQAPQVVPGKNNSVMWRHLEFCCCMDKFCHVENICHGEKFCYLTDILLLSLPCIVVVLSQNRPISQKSCKNVKYEVCANIQRGKHKCNWGQGGETGKLCLRNKLASSKMRKLKSWQAYKLTSS